MKKLVSLFVAILTLVVSAVLATVEKQNSGSSPPAQNFITIAEDDVNSLNTFAMIVNRPAMECCGMKEVIKNTSQTSLTLVTLPTTREGCRQKNDVYVRTQSIMKSSKYAIKNYYMLKCPMKFESVGIKTFYV